MRRPVRTGRRPAPGGNGFAEIPSRRPDGAWERTPYPAATGILWTCAIADFYDMPVEGYMAIWTDPEGETLWPGEQVPPNPDLEGTDYLPDYTPPVVEGRDGLVSYTGYWTGRAMLFDVTGGRGLARRALSGANFPGPSHICPGNPQLRRVPGNSRGL